MFLQPERPRPSGPQESFKRKLQQNGVDQCGVAARRYTAGCCYRICGCLLIPFATSERVWKIGRLNNITTADSLSTESSKTNSCDLSTTFSLMNQTSASRVLGRRLRTTYTLQGENCSEVPHEKLDKLLSLDLLKNPKVMNLRQRVRDSFRFHLNHVPSRDDTDCLYWQLNISFLLK